MDVELPAPIAIYFAAENQGHTEIVAQCFAEHAVVRDEGQTIKGLAAIKQWTTETKGNTSTRSSRSQSSRRMITPS